jgi:hypothetical protein
MRAILQTKFAFTGMFYRSGQKRRPRTGSRHEPGARLPRPLALKRRAGAGGQKKSRAGAADFLLEKITNSHDNQVR